MDLRPGLFEQHDPELVVFVVVETWFFCVFVTNEIIVHYYFLPDSVYAESYYVDSVFVVVFYKEKSFYAMGRVCD